MPHAAYLDTARSILDHLGATQPPQVEAAAVCIAAAIAAGGTVSCSEIGHGIQGDFINRAGGLIAVQPFTFRVDVQHPLAECRRHESETQHADRDLETVRAAVRMSDLRAGDVMLVSSVSGRNRRPIELALACRDIGVGVIAFTAATYTSRVKSLHPSGKRHPGKTAKNKAKNAIKAREAEEARKVTAAEKKAKKAAEGDKKSNAELKKAAKHAGARA